MIFSVGKIADVDIHLHKYFESHNIESFIIRKSKIDYNKMSFFNVNNESVIYEDNLKKLKKFNNNNILFSINGGVLGLLFRHPELLIYLSKFRIYNVSTGADFSELLLSKSIKGFIYRAYLKFLSLNSWTVATNDIIQNTQIYEYTRKSIFINLPFFWPTSENDLSDLSDSNELNRFLHLSNLDWGITDNKTDRNSFKANDLFIYALKVLKDMEFLFSCTIAFRGPDRFVAYKLVYDFNLENHINWVDNFEDYNLLVNEIDRHNLIVDQFYMSGLGGIANLALARGKKLLSYVDDDVFSNYKHSIPPIINCNSVDSIVSGILNHKKLDSIHSSKVIKNWYISFNKSDFVLSRVKSELIKSEL